MGANKFIEDKYGLAKNPFLDRIARESWLSTWVDRDEQLSQWQAVISNLEAPQKNYIVFIIGDYGRGKTQSLMKIIAEAEKHNVILPAFLNFRGEQKPTAPGLDFIFRIFKSIDFRGLREIYGDKLQIAVEAIPDDLDEVKTVLKNLCFAEQSVQNMALYFLRGEFKPTKADLRQLGIIRKIDDIDIAKEYLAGILNLLKTLGFQTLLLAVDEVEYLFSLVSKPQQSIYLALLRGLFDFPLGIPKKTGDIAKIAIFLAISEDGYRRLRDIEKEEMASGGPTRPLLDRVDIETRLAALTKQYARELIIKRLHFDRIEGRYTKQPLIPFEENFIDFIWEITEGVPRDIIVKCMHVLDAGIEKGIPRLNREIAEALLRERKEL